MAEEVSKLPSSPRGELEHVTISVLRPTSAASHVSSEKSITQSPTMIPKLPPAPFVRVPSPPLRIKSGKKSQGSSRMGSPVKSMGSPMPTSSRNSVRGSRPGSAKSSISSLSSEFLGSAQMESLLQGLHNENKAGGFFMTFLERTENTTWINCLQCWHELQSYHEKFYAEIFNSYELDKKAQAVHSKYIVEGCKYSIGVDSDTRKQIYREIDPPFEELFDSAEEHILQLLVMPWTLMSGSDKALYQKIELVEEKRHLETSKSKHLKSLQRRGLFKERVATPEFIDEDTKREAYFLSLEDRVPEEFKDFSFNTLIHNRLELEQFRLFLNDNYASMDLMCWLDIEAFRRIPHSDNERRDEKAKEIKQKYLNKKYFFGPNSPAGKEGQNKVMQAGGGWGKILQDRPPTPVLLEVQKYVRERLERRWLPMFICTSDFQERQHPQVKMDEVVDDVMMNKRKKTQQVWKMLESRWVSSSRDIIAFRKVLMNPVSCMHFRKFVSVRGENLENDVLFWLEVQRYKDLYHAHTEDGIIHQKIQAVIHCFLDSQIPPPLQIDIPQEQAEKILDKRPKEMGPYVFREAQLTVFRVLFAHWADFCNYRNTMDESKMVEELEKKRRRHRARERARQRALEEREAKEEVRRARREKGLAEEDDDDSEMRSQAGSTVIPASPLADFLQEEEEEQHIQWRYSNYIKALEKEEAIMNADEKASSILSSSELGSMTTKSATEDAKDESKSDETVEVHGDKKKRLSISQDMDVKGVRKINKGGKENDKSKQTNNMDGNTTDVQSDTHRGKKKVSMAIDGKDERPGSGGEKVKKVKMTLNGKSPRQTVPALKIKK
uniref:Regulator of G-protein signaling 22-like n=1 Tax=Saccoglossus kowalevskii TaxID=10224 RepID=A0ABM0MVY1_SACKO|nr:PREDICTED: regulator of G-protein signaling 22-like [Saccoglossus kowalevskii]